jgi:hypothetical protein
MRPMPVNRCALRGGGRRVDLTRWASASVARAGLGARIDGARQGGIVLPGALILASMVLATSAVWFEIAMAQTRHAANVHDHIRATQAADGALLLCAQALRAGVAPVLPARGGDRAHWKEAAAFQAAEAYEPVPSWAGSARPPQCVIEAMSIEGRPDASAYCITARGFGAKASTEAWLQLVLMTEAGRERRAWRRIATGPVRR